MLAIALQVSIISLLNRVDMQVLIKVYIIQLAISILMTTALVIMHELES